MSVLAEKDAGLIKKKFLKIKQLKIETFEKNQKKFMAGIKD